MAIYTHCLDFLYCRPQSVGPWVVNMIKYRTTIIPVLEHYVSSPRDFLLLVETVYCVYTCSSVILIIF